MSIQNSINSDLTFSLLLGRIGVRSTISQQIRKEVSIALSSCDPRARESFVNIATNRYRLFSPWAQETIRTAVARDFNALDRAQFLQANAFYLSTEQKRECEPDHSLMSRLIKIESSVNAWRRGESKAPLEDLAELEGDLIDYGSLYAMSRYAALPVTLSERFTERMLAKLGESGQIEVVANDELAKSYRVLTEDAYSFLARDFISTKFDERGTYNGLPSASLSDFYLEQPFGIYIIESNSGNKFMYTQVADTLRDTKGVSYPSVSEIKSQDDKKAVIATLNNEGMYSFLARHPLFKQSMICVKEDDTNPLNILFHLAHNPAYQSYFSPAQQLSTKELVNSFEEGFRFRLYDCLRSPCRNYEALFSNMTSLIEQIADPMSKQTVALAYTKVALESPSRIVRNAILQHVVPTYEVIGVLENAAFNDEDLSTRVRVAEKLLALCCERDGHGSAAESWPQRVARVDFSALTKELRVDLSTNDDVAVYSTMTACPLLSSALGDSQRPVQKVQPVTRARGFEMR